MSTSAASSETFSSVDAAWLHMDTPTNLAIITGVLTFTGPIDEDRLKKMLKRRLLAYERFKQRVQEPALPLGLPRWETDPDFHIDRHVEHIPLEQPADHAALQDLVGEMIGQPMDRTRPLWKFYLVDMQDGSTSIICRLHHSIADGLALVQVLLSTADTRPDGDEISEEETAPEERRRPGLLRRLTWPARWAGRMAARTWHTAESMAHEGMQILSSPARLTQAARFGVGATRSLAKLLLIPPDRRTSLRGSCGVTKRAVWSVAIDLEEVKAIGRLMGGTVNDILLSALTGGLRRYLESRGDRVQGLNLRGIVPFSLRPPGEIDKMGNQFGLVFLSLPIGIVDPLKRLLVLKRRMNAIKQSPEALVAFGILGAIGLTPVQIEHIIVSIFGMKGTGVLTNVPGPRQPLYFAGQMIDTLMFWVPTPGNLGLGVSIISYNGRVMMGVATDAGLIPDPEKILEGFIDELDHLGRWGRSPEQAGRQTVEPPTPESEAALEEAPAFGIPLSAAPEIEAAPPKATRRKRAGRKAKPASGPAAEAVLPPSDAPAATTLALDEEMLAAPEIEAAPPKAVRQKRASRKGKPASGPAVETILQPNDTPAAITGVLPVDEAPAAPETGAAAENETAELRQPEVETQPQHCLAITKAGTRCKNPALPGAATCRVHSEA